MTKDFDRKWRQENEEDFNTALFLVATAAIMIISIALLLTAFTPTADAEEPINNPYANMISPEMHSYTHDSKTGRKQFIRLEDVE